MSKGYLIYELIYFMILYVGGVISGYKWREDTDILYLSRDQWFSIFMMFIPVFIGGFIK